MEKMQVIKRDGRLEEMNVEKIHAATKFATDGLNASQSEVELAAHLMLFNEIKTEDIQKALIISAAGLISTENPDYSYVAARLLLQTIYKEVVGSKVEYPHLAKYIEKGVSSNLLTLDLLDFDLERLNSRIRPERDYQFDYLGLQTIADRYLVRSRAEGGQPQNIIEMPQHFWMRVAMGLAINEGARKNEMAIEFYDVLSKFEFVSSTPTLFNSGTLHPQMSSCYGNTVQDAIFEDSQIGSTGDGIFGTISECALLSKYAGGIGTDWTRVRGLGDPIKGTNGKSSGVVPYLKVYNDTAVAVNQCHTPDTLIYTNNGIKRIADVSVGDLVVGLRGSYREVLDVMKYDQNEKPMVEIDVKHSVKPMQITSGHPVWAITDVAKEQSVSRTYGQIESGKIVQKWTDAGDLKSGDYVGQIVPKEIVVVDGFSDDHARLYGIMLGDGHCHKRVQKNQSGVEYETKEWGVTGLTDEDSIQFVRKYLIDRDIYFYESELQGAAIQIKWSFSGKRLDRDEFGKFVASENCLPFDYEDLYDEDHNKRISARLSFLPPSQTWSMIQGLIESDGCVSRGKEITFTNTSEMLAEGLRYQLLRMSVPSSGNIRVRSNEHLSGNSEESTVWDIRIPACVEIAERVGCKPLSKRNWLELNGVLFSRIKSVVNIDPVPVVYDLKVEGDESYMTTSAIVHNGGKRNGAFAPYLEPWHPDFVDFIDLKKNSGDERRRAHDIFPAAWIPDLFMQRVKEDDMWSFFSPHENPDLHELYGDEFTKRYEYLEQHEPHLIRGQIKASDLWKKMITSLFETGHPWITFKDEHNRRNPQSHVGVIHNSNLCCMTGDQRVVTDAGIMTVGELYESKRVNKVVGLSEYSDASKMLLPRPDAPIVRIDTAEGYEHKVTPDHRVWVKDKGWVEAQDLIAGDKLLTQQIEGMFGEQHFPKLALIAGLVAGDGTYLSKEGSESVCIDLWGEKTGKFVPIIEKVVRQLIEGEKLHSSSVADPKFAYNLVKDSYRLCSAPLARVLSEMGFNKSTKLEVPDFVWKGTKPTVMSYLRGLYLTDGNIQVGKDATCMALSSTSVGFLKEIQILWANFGVKSSMNKVHNGGARDFGDGYGKYECKPVWRLLITSIQGCQIAECVTMLGRYRTGDSAETFVSNLNKKGYKQKLYATFTGLTELPNEDAYCLTVNSETHAWTVNGLITHNTEISLNNSDLETFVCNLGSVNLSKIQHGRFREFFARVVPVAIRMLDNVIDINFYPSEKARNSNMRHRPIGLGAMGESELLVMQGIKWGSDEHLQFIDEVYEALSYNAISESCMLAQERGVYSTFEGSKWSEGILPIHTAKTFSEITNVPTKKRDVEPYDWDNLAQIVKRRGMRNCNVMALAPTATIANIVGTEPCHEPPFELTANKSNLSGNFIYIAPSLRHGKPELCKDAFSIDQTKIIRAGAVRQRWVDQSQSLNIFVNNNTTGRELSGLYFLAWELGLKSTYYLKTKSAKIATVEEPLSEMKSESDILDVWLDEVALTEAQICSIENGPNCTSCE